MDFQVATANHILHLFKDKGQKRVLLADEVGLGKTIVAKEVIDMVAKWHKESTNKSHFKVVYICSNVGILQQNAQKLGIRDTLSVSDSRLSMQHLLINEKSGNDSDYMQLIPLTPNTSFSISNGRGTQAERALMFVHLSRLSELKNSCVELSDVMRFGTKNWNEIVERYKLRADNCNKNGTDYYNKMDEKLHSKLYENYINHLIDYCSRNKNERNNDGTRKLISDLRSIFAEISLDVLNPDLVIMDEFQRFKSLLNSEKGSEQNLLMSKFLSNENTKVLLLSATPYKPYTTLEELNENNTDEQYDDFMQLMNFLHHNQNCDVPFKTVWNDYTSSLVCMDLTTLIARKNQAESRLYDVMCRTERFNTGIINDTNTKAVKISEGDILSYCQMNDLIKVFDNINKGNNESVKRNIPIDYTKSCPYLISFMDNNNYKLKSDIVDAFYKSRENPKKYVSKAKQIYVLKTNRIYNYQNIESNNAKLDYLKKILFSNGAELLLWIPASKPYYRVRKGVYEKNADFSKVLVFSAWEMVPKMLSVLLSYEAERLTIPKMRKDSYRKKFNGRLNTENKAVITYVSEFLSSLYSPEEYYGQEISAIRKDIKNKINVKLHDIKEKYGIKKYVVTSAKSTLSLLKVLDDDYTTDLETPSIAKNSAEILTEIAISSPANVLYRILKDKQLAANAAENFVSLLFNNRTATAIVDILHPKDEYYIGVLKYCTDGNLQAVMDEYCHMLQEQGSKLYELINKSFFKKAPLEIDTTDSFYNKSEKKKMSMRTGYAIKYGNIKINDQTVNRSEAVRYVFNSPFRPFVLASTSIGQEGLDFHWYARKIVHWNLPSNPVDLEQREGRINRYKCLAIRRDVAHRYPELFSWDEMFDAATKEFRKNYSEMVPYWCLPPEMKEAMEKDGQKFEQIERIIPWYPLSIEQSKYKRLIDVLSLYRLTMGQPRQEELLQLLQDKLTEEQMKELLIDLSPSSEKHKIINGVKNSTINLCLNQH